MKYGRSEFFEDLDQMREMIIFNWNNLVEPEDTVYILGDIVMGQRDVALPHLARLNGNKRLILGNHDYPHPSNKEKIVDKWTPIYGEYFEYMTVDEEIEIADSTALLVHFPADGDHTEEIRYADWRPEYDGWIIHGHLHVEEKIVAEKHVHIGIDADYTDYGIPRYSPIPFNAVDDLIRRNS